MLVHIQRKSQTIYHSLKPSWAHEVSGTLRINLSYSCKHLPMSGTRCQTLHKPFIYIITFNHHSKRALINPIVQMRSLGPREVKGLAQDHTAI